MTALRAHLRQVFGVAADARPRSTLSTGYVALDALLTGGGLPRGGLTTFAGTGMTGLLHHLAARLTRDGIVAWVDPDDTLDVTALYAAGADLAGLLVARPPAGPRTVRAVVLLLEELAPELLIVDVPSIAPHHARWLQQVARAADQAAVVLLAPPAPWLAEAADLVLLSHRVGWRRDGNLLRGSTLEVVVARQRGGRTGVAVTIDLSLPRPVPWPAGLERAAAATTPVRERRGAG